MASDIHSGFVGRLEVVQTGRRRRWTPEQKASIILESLSGRESVSTVARRRLRPPRHVAADDLASALDRL